MSKIARISFKRLTALFLAASFIFSMSACKPGKNAEQIQADFDAFTDEIFASDMTENILNLHWSVAFPENYGIEDYEVSFGSFSKEYEDESWEELEDTLEALKNFDYELLDRKSVV